MRRALANAVHVLVDISKGNLTQQFPGAASSDEVGDMTAAMRDMSGELHEIRTLARQTAAATEDIKRRITGVQSCASSGIGAIEKISDVIREVTDIVSCIAAAIEERAAVTKDISRNISEASSGVQDANRQVVQSSIACDRRCKASGSKSEVTPTGPGDRS